MQGRNDTLLIVTADHETGGLTATNQGAGNYPTATWTTSDHTGVNVPLYATGANVNLLNNYIVGGVMDNTKIFNFMSTAFTTPVPGAERDMALATGLSGVLVLRRGAR